MSLIVVEAIRGRCASFMILTATVSEIFGRQDKLIYFSNRAYRRKRANSRFFIYMIIDPMFTFKQCTWSRWLCIFRLKYGIIYVIKHYETCYNTYINFNQSRKLSRFATKMSEGVFVNVVGRVYFENNYTRCIEQ